MTVGAHQDTGPNGEPDGVPFLRFSDGALALFIEWRSDLERRLRGGDLHPAMESHIAKYRKLVPGLALILHLSSSGTGSVSERATLQALAWAEYLETHARRAYASISIAEGTAAKAIIERIRKGALPRTFSSWQVWRPGWAMLSDRHQVAGALSPCGSGLAIDIAARNRRATGHRLRGQPERTAMMGYLDRLKGTVSEKQAPTVLQKLQKARFDSFCSTQGAHVSEIEAPGALWGRVAIREPGGRTIEVDTGWTLADWQAYAERYHRPWVRRDCDRRASQASRTPIKLDEALRAACAVVAGITVEVFRSLWRHDRR